jgi:tRNA pseudouridine38-40 synthase
MRVKLTVAYDGTDFVGWQRQSLPGANNRSVQGELEHACKRLLRQEVSIQGAGRTDSGVHALGQVASFETELRLPIEQLRYALNNLLPPDVRVLQAEQAAPDFHARFSAKTKEYRYYLAPGRQAGAFDYRYAWFCPYALDLAAMQQAAAMLTGEHNFRTFCGKSAVVKTYVRTLYTAEMERCEAADVPQHLAALAAGGELYCFRVAGNGFIYKMVRLLTGALVKVGAGKLALADFAAGLANPGEQPLAPAAPACGLYLYSIGYDEAN